MKGYNKKTHQKLDLILGPLTEEDLEQNEQVEELKSHGHKRGPCGKVMFASMGAARKAAKWRMKTGANVDRLRAYFCEECKSFHISSSFRKQQKK
jgi:hypothetical protein